MVVPSIKDVVRCPTCGSRDIVYTCEPKCCFNHLCSECRTTFQLVTRKSSRSVDALPAEEPASGDPTAACAACESLKIAVADASSPPLLACSECHSALELAYEDVAPDTP